MTNHTGTKLIDALRGMLAEQEELHGTEVIVCTLSQSRAKTYVLRIAKTLEENGELTIIRSRGGRGHRTIYRRNPNSPGAPIRKRGKR